MAPRLHVLLVNNYTARGGIPKAVATLANGLSLRGHRVSVFSQKPVSRLLLPLARVRHRLDALSLPPGKRAPLPPGTARLDELYPLEAAVQVLPYSFSDNNLRIQRLRRQIRELDPDVCVCLLPDGAQLVWAVTLLGTGVPYVCSERTAPEAVETLFWSRKGRLSAMSGADAIHLLLPSYAASLPDFLRERVTVIPNAVRVPTRAADTAGAPGARKVLLWQGRLQEEVKQCRMALDAFALLARDFPGWDLRVAGDGPDRREIVRHARGLGLGERIVFNGVNADPEGLCGQAQAFCISSRMEGMPNALLEAMAAGLPCVAFRGCPGMTDIIEDGATGLLAGRMDARALAESLARILGDASLRRELGGHAREAMRALAPERVMDAWEELLVRAAASKGHTVMDGFGEEPFASLARMSSKARQEWAIRDFGRPMPDSLEYAVTSLPGRLCARWRGRPRWLGGPEA